MFSQSNYCKYCNGCKQTVCLSCYGIGKMYSDGMREYICDECDGRGRVICVMCSGTGNN
jgi:hypothetical protein